MGTSVSRDVSIYLDEIGKCVAPETVSIQPQISGKIIEMHFKEGSDVKRGEILFTIDPRPFEAQLDQAKADLAVSQAAVQQSEAALLQNKAAVQQAQAELAQNKARQALNQMEFERARNLLETHAIAKQEFDSKQVAVTVGESQIKASAAAVAAAEAQIEQTNAAIAMAKAKIGANQAAIRAVEINLGYTSIVSPMDARAGQRLVDPGNVVTANTTSLLVIQKLDPVYAEFTVPEAQLGRVRKSMEAGQLKALCAVPGAPESPREGEVFFLDNSIQDATGTIRLRAKVQNGDRYFWPGLFVNVRLLLGVKKDAVLVPEAALQVGQAGTFVFVLKPDSTVEMRPVKPGQRQGEDLVIEEGVNAGERIVLTGQMMLFPGAKAQVKDETKAAEKSEAPAK